MNVFKRIGAGFKWLGKKALWLFKRNEVLLAVQLAIDIIPIPALDKIILLIRSIDDSAKPGIEKMAIALEEIWPILEEYDIKIGDESDLRFLIELAVKIMKGRARVIETD